MKANKRRDSIVGQATPPGAESRAGDGAVALAVAPTEIGATMARDNQSKAIRAKRFSQDKGKRCGVESISLERRKVGGTWGRRSCGCGGGGCGKIKYASRQVKDQNQDQIEHELNWLWEEKKKQLQLRMIDGIRIEEIVSAQEK
ncbi:uncharacterized protein [Drosophila kikkawai]|uniref:Uncharacterized protein n=1 Tax=Drosophila kikkawai TaxID=30033 RepID=A0ABM4GPY4_DROKI